MQYEWIVVGGGVAGIALSEILTRQGHSVLLVEKNAQLASEVTKGFHEWIHTGSLYTLIPDKMLTLKYMLGAIDDLLEFYGSFTRMNLTPTGCGLGILDDRGWFKSEYIHFRYRVSGRRAVLPWTWVIARSIFLIDSIKKHDWLRRRGGVLEQSGLTLNRELIRQAFKVFRCKGRFHDYRTSDFTTHSRRILRDLLATAIANGLDLSLSNAFIRVEADGKSKRVFTEKGVFEAQNVALCLGGNVGEHSNALVTTSYAPMAVVDNVPEGHCSFVELDYFTRNCINMLKKDAQLALIGGISLKKKSDCQPYLDYVIREHQKYLPGLKVLHKYVGLKHEITFKGQPRNYLFHIVEGSPGVWSVIPGKFTLAFSLAPEFYRRVYRKNPDKAFKTTVCDDRGAQLVAETVWFEEGISNIKKEGENRGHD